MIVSSCSSKYKVLTDNQETKNISISKKFNSIEIIDNRENVTSDKIQISKVSFKGKSDKVSPVLTDNQKQTIEKQIEGYFTGTNPEVKVRCFISQGFQEVKVKGFRKREYTQIDNRIELLDLNNNVLSFTRLLMQVD